jgi:DNA-damage-inducible protein D
MIEKKFPDIVTLLLKAKDFATEITKYKVKVQKISCKSQISSEHVTNNKAVRDLLVSRGIVKIV